MKFTLTYRFNFRLDCLFSLPQLALREKERNEFSQPQLALDKRLSCSCYPIA